MQAVKAVFKEGHVHLLAPLPCVTEAELLVIVLDKDESTQSVVNFSRLAESHSEQDFKSLGLSGFFETEEDLQVDWEEAFDVKAR